MNVHAPLSMSKDAYFAWIDRQEGRYEYARGHVMMMVRVTLGHALVTTNLLATLKSCLPAERFNIAAEAFAVDTGDSVRYPDIVVQLAQADHKALQAAAPLLVGEVLSPGTLHVDFGEKRQEYLGLPTLNDYIILSPDEPRVWLWQRKDGAFPTEPEIIEGLDRAIRLETLNIEIALRAIYQGVI